MGWDIGGRPCARPEGGAENSPSPVLWRTEPEAPKQVREGVNSGRSFALVEIIIIYITLMMWHATSDDATSTPPPQRVPLL